MQPTATEAGLPGPGSQGRPRPVCPSGSRARLVQAMGGSLRRRTVLEHSVPRAGRSAMLGERQSAGDTGPLGLELWAQGWGCLRHTL